MSATTSGSVARWAFRSALTAVAAVLFVIAARSDIAEACSVFWISAVYIAAGLFAFRFAGFLAKWVLPVGLALAALEITNIYLEQFVGLPAPANAIVPASMMAAIVLFASTSAVVGSAGHNAVSGVVSAVAVIAFGMLVSVTAVLAFSPPSSLMFDNAAMHLTLPPLLALVAGLLAIAISKATQHRYRVSLAAFPLLVIGVVLLVHAASLPRSERPDFVLPGMALSALALICLPCFLSRAGDVT